VRGLLAIACLALPGAGLGQGTDPATVAPDVLVTVREHPTTADIVEATARDPRVAPERLREAAMRLGRRTGSEPRGLDVRLVPLAGPAGTKVARVYFATDNVIDRESGRIDFTGLVRAFCDPKGDPPIRNLAILLDGEQPVLEKTMKVFRDDKVWLRAAASDEPPGIEVRVSLQTDDVDGVEIPDFYEPEAEAAPTKPAEEDADPPAGILWALVAVAGIAAAALVYSLLARRLPRRV
jgi:hypothetical protein